MQSVLFIVSKVLRPMLTSPLFLSLLASSVALLMLKAASRLARILKIAALVFIAITTLLSIPAAANGIAALWEYPLADVESASARSPRLAAIVLGGSLDPVSSKPGRLEGWDSFERLSSAAALYRKGLVPQIFFTGGSGSLTWPGKKEAPFALEFLELLGVPPNAVIIEDQSRNTYENAIYTRRIVSELLPSALADASNAAAPADGQAPVLLVTSAWHMRRAAALFRKAGFRFEPYAVDSLIEAPQMPKDLFPDAWALERSTRILREMIGFAAYWVLGRL